MKIRQGLAEKQNLYVQLGGEPSSDDQYIGVIFNPQRAAVIVDILNGDRPPLDRRLRGREICLS